MSNYTKSTNFTAKDSLPGGDTNKVVRGSEFDTEFNAISTAVATKADLAGPTFTGTITLPTVDINAGAIDGTTIGGSSAAAGTFTNLTASGTVNFNGATVSNLGTITTANLDGGSVDGAIIGANTAAAGTFTALAATSATVGGAAVLTSVSFSNLDAGAVTTSGETFADSDTQLPTNASVIDYVAATIPLITEINDLSANVTWANVPDANITQSSVTQHQAALAIAATQITSLTSTVTELNLVDGSTADTVVNSKAVIYGAAGQVTANELDVDNIQLDGNSISSTNTDGNIQLSPNGTGYTELRGNTNAGAIRFNCESNSHGVTLKGPPHSATATYTLELPNADGSAGQFLKTDGSGKLSFDTVSVNNITGDVNITGELLADSYNETFKKLTSSSTTLGYQMGSISIANTVSTLTDLGSTSEKYSTIFFKSDGTKFWVAEHYPSYVIRQYTLSTAWDISSTITGTSQTASQMFGVTDNMIHAFSSDGQYVFGIGRGSSALTVYRSALATAWDITSTKTITSQSSAIAGTGYDFAMYVHPSGTKLFVLDDASQVFEFSFGTAYDVTTLNSTATASKNFYSSTASTPASSMEFSSDGTKLYLAQYNGTYLMYEFPLSTAWDISSASTTANSSTAVANGTLSAIGIPPNKNGEKVYTLEKSREFREYNFSSVAKASTLNCENGNVFELVLEGNTTVTFSNPPAAGTATDSTAYGMSLKVIQDSGASGYTITWPTSVDWPSATAPTLTATASAVDQFVFYTYDGGTNWYGFTAGQALG